MKKLTTRILKILISVLLLYWVFSKIPLSEVWTVIKTSGPGWLLLALVCFVASQWISSRRLLILFHQTDFKLLARSNDLLYLIGMFYNFFIPGGIGGDAYKVYKLNKEFSWSSKKLTAALFVDRFMGLTAIGILVLPLFLLVESAGWMYLLVLAGLLLGVMLSRLFIAKAFPNFTKSFWLTLLYSLAVQGLQVGCVLCLFYAIGGGDNSLAYVLTFLVSSVLSIFSFAGIGVREYVFYQASVWLQIDAQQAVAVGFLFSILTAFVSLFGIFLHFRGISLQQHSLE